MRSKQLQWVDVSKLQMVSIPEMMGRMQGSSEWLCAQLPPDFGILLVWDDHKNETWLGTMMRPYLPMPHSTHYTLFGTGFTVSAPCHSFPLCRYNHKLMKLAEAALREVADFRVEEDRFQVGYCFSTWPSGAPPP